jgi:transposase
VTHRRLWCPFGERPPWVHEHQYRWLWLYAVVEPSSGRSFVLFLPHTDGVCFQLFLDAVRQEFPDRPLGLVLDSSGSHTSDKVCWPQDLFPIPLPAYSPELNPAERWFEDLRRLLANRIFDTLADLEQALIEALKPYWVAPGRLQRLTGYSWWCEAVRAIAPSRRSDPLCPSFMKGSVSVS